MTPNLRFEVPRVFRPLLEPRRYQGAYGGRGSGKSHFFAEKLVAEAHSEPIRAVCIREVQNTIRDSVRQLIVDKIQKFDLGREFEVTDTEIRSSKGSLIIFRGMQHYNAENIKSLENFDIAWVEEAQTFSQTSLDLLRPTIRNEGSELWFSWNPRNASDPVDAFFRGEHKHPKAVAVEVNWHDNPWFPQVLREEKDADYAADPDKAEHVWGGGYQIIVEGAYYARLLATAEKEGRVGVYPYNPNLPVFTGWDLGKSDDTSIWFAQRQAGWFNIIDHYATNGQEASHYVQVLQKKPYTYATHFLPHDADRSDGWINGRNRLSSLRDMAPKYDWRVMPLHPIEDGINAVRILLPQCRFHLETTKNGLESLKYYRRDYDEERRVFKPTPLHNWASHDADGFRSLAVGIEPEAAIPPDIPRYSGRRFRDRQYRAGSHMSA